MLVTHPIEALAHGVLVVDAYSTLLAPCRYERGDATGTVGDVLERSPEIHPEEVGHHLLDRPPRTGSQVVELSHGLRLGVGQLYGKVIVWVTHPSALLEVIVMEGVRHALVKIHGYSLLHLPCALRIDWRHLRHGRLAGELAKHCHLVAGDRENDGVAVGMVGPLPDVGGYLNVNDWIHKHKQFSAKIQRKIEITNNNPQ